MATSKNTTVDSLVKAGRPATGNVQISIRLPKAVLDKLSDLANEQFSTKSQVIARLIMTAPHQ